MDRLIGIAWRTFWVGLGASAVLIGQSVLASRDAEMPARMEAPSTIPTPPSPTPPFQAHASYVPRT